MTLDQLDEKTIYYGVYRTLQKHKDIWGLRGLASRFGRSPTPGARRPDRRCERGSLGC